MSDIAIWIQEWRYDAFDTEIDPMLTAAAEIDCGDSGLVRPGAVFACSSSPQTVSGFALENAGVVVYVIDGTGRAAWRDGDVPASSRSLLDTYGLVPKGLMCRDLLSGSLELPLFASNPRDPANAFFWSLVYWSLEGQPDRMDADHDGVPCESLYDPAVVEAVLAGGPVGIGRTPPLGLALRPDGLGAIDFGTPAGETVDSLVFSLGEPDSDEMSHRSDVGAPAGGVCLGGYTCEEYVRLLGWDRLGLRAVMSDIWWTPAGGYPPPVVPMSFVGYHYWGGQAGVINTPEGVRDTILITPDGIGVGSSVADLTSAYGDRLLLIAGADGGCDGSPGFIVRLDEYNTPFGGSGYFGWLSDDPSIATSVVRSIAAGASEGC